VITLPAPPPRIARLPRNHADRPALPGKGALSLAAQVVALVSGTRARLALAAAVPANPEIGPRVRVVLGAVSARPQLDRTGASRGVHRLGDHFKMGDLNAVPVNTSPLGDVVNRQPLRNWPNFTNPYLAMGVTVTAEPPVSVRVVRALPSQAPALRIAYRCRIVIPALPFRGRPAALSFIATRHRTVRALAALIENGSATRLASEIHGLAEPLQVGAGSGAAALLRRTLGGVVGMEVDSAARALTRRIHPWHTPILVRRTAINPESTEGAQ
jgi:hypothetical protein